MEKDELYLYFTTGVSDNRNEITYALAFTKGRWHSIFYDSMMINCHHKTLQQGEIKNGLTRNIEKVGLVEKSG